jgi:hypothetical protein
MSGGDNVKRFLGNGELRSEFFHRGSRYMLRHKQTINKQLQEQWETRGVNVIGIGGFPVHTVEGVTSHLPSTRRHPATVQYSARVKQGFAESLTSIAGIWWWRDRSCTKGVIT